MIQICSRAALDEFLERERAMLLFAASWSGYANISRQMTEFVETYAQMREIDVPFYFGQFEDDLTPLAETLTAAGVPTWAFGGNGSLSFFRGGRHLHTMRSVIGEGTFAVWAHIDDLLGETTS